MATTALLIRNASDNPVLSYRVLSSHSANVNEVIYPRNKLTPLFLYLSVKKNTCYDVLLVDSTGSVSNLAKLGLNPSIKANHSFFKPPFPFIEIHTQGEA